MRLLSPCLFTLPITTAGATLSIGGVLLGRAVSRHEVRFQEFPHLLRSLAGETVADA